jgi:TetR/AcrR family transcriptional regulator, transcriptional repressor for nem operon
MRKSKEGKEETRRLIVDVAARMFKSQGIGATGVGEIMANAGMTHGAFYRHFSSKEELVAEASATSMAAFVEAAEAASAAGPEAFVKYLQDYLTTEYRDGKLGGCPVVQTGGELALGDQATRQGVSDGLERLIELGVELTDGSAAAKADVIFTMSAMLGAITVSRLVSDPALSKAVLEVVKRRLAAPTEPATPAAPAKSKAKRATASA